MPRGTEITVSAGRTFNHPYESYSNMRPMVTMKAEVLDGEDLLEVTKALQAQAEGLVEDHKRHMLRSIEELHDMSVKQARIAGLRSTIERAQRELDDARKALPATDIIADALELEDEDEDEGPEIFSGEFFL